MERLTMHFDLEYARLLLLIKRMQEYSDSSQGISNNWHQLITRLKTKLEEMLIKEAKWELNEEE